MVGMFIAIFIVLNASGESIGDLRSEARTLEECQRLLVEDGPKISDMMRQRGLSIVLPGTCEQAGDPV